MLNTPADPSVIPVICRNWRLVNDDPILAAPEAREVFLAIRSPLPDRTRILYIVSSVANGEGIVNRYPTKLVRGREIPYSYGNTMTGELDSGFWTLNWKY